jgi:hypothetical protein
MMVAGFALKIFISFSPGCSPVLKRDRRWLTVLTVCLVQLLQQPETEVVPSSRNLETVETVIRPYDLITGL